MNNSNKQPTDKPTEQPKKLSTYEPAIFQKQSTNKPTNQPTNQPTDQPNNYLMNKTSQEKKTNKLLNQSRN